MSTRRFFCFPQLFDEQLCWVLAYICASEPLLSHIIPFFVYPYYDIQLVANILGCIIGGFVLAFLGHSENAETQQRCREINRYFLCALTNFPLVLLYSTRYGYIYGAFFFSFFFFTSGCAFHFSFWCSDIFLHYMRGKECISWIDWYNTNGGLRIRACLLIGIICVTSASLIVTPWYLSQSHHHAHIFNDLTDFSLNGLFLLLTFLGVYIPSFFEFSSKTTNLIACVLMQLFLMQTKNHDNNVNASIIMRAVNAFSGSCSSWALLFIETRVFFDPGGWFGLNVSMLKNVSINFAIGLLFIVIYSWNLVGK